MGRKTLIMVTSLGAGLLILAALVFAGSFSNGSVDPPCGEIGNYYYEVTYCCDPEEDPPNTVVVTVYKQSVYVTSAIMDVVAVGEVCHTFGQYITLNDTGDDYSFNFRIYGGPPTSNFAGPLVLEDSEDCP